MEEQKKKAPLPRWAQITIRIARIIMVPALCFLALFIGMIIGYVTIGNEQMSDVFKMDTWKHLFDLVFKDNLDS